MAGEKLVHTRTPVGFQPERRIQAVSAPEIDPLMLALRERGTMVTKSPGEILFEEGKEATQLHFIVAGSLKLITERTNETISGKKITKRLTFTTLYDGDIAGTEAIAHPDAPQKQFSGYMNSPEVITPEETESIRYCSTAIAEKESQIISLSVEEFEELMRSNPLMLPYFLPRFAAAVARAETKSHLFEGEITQRLAGTLLDTMDEDGIVGLTHQQLAEYVGVVRETVTKDEGFKQLKDADVVTKTKPLRVVKKAVLQDIVAPIIDPHPGVISWEKAHPAGQINRSSTDTASIIKLIQQALSHLNGKENSPDTTRPATEERVLFAGPFVPDEIKTAGEIVHNLITQFKLPRYILAREIAVNRNIDVFTDFEIGKFTGIPLSRYIEAVKTMVYESNEGIQQLKKIAEEQRWLKTFSQKDMTLGMALTLLRLDQGVYKKTYAAQNHTDKYQTTRHEKNRRKPVMYNLNRRITASSLNPEGKPAQLLRLLRENMAPMTFNQLRTCGIGKLMRYIRILKGATIKNLSKPSVLDCTKLQLGAYERGEDAIPDAIVQRFISWLHEPDKSAPADSAIDQLIRQKTAHPEQVSDVEVVQKALGEKYLFAEHIAHLEPYAPKTELHQTLDGFTTLKPMVLHVLNLIEKEDKRVGTSNRYLHLFKNIKRGHIPRIETILQLTQDINLGLHDQLTQMLLLQTIKEQQAQ